jgi:hypothetical protein
MRPIEQYAEMAEKAIDKSGVSLENMNQTHAVMHMQAALVLSNLAVAAATFATLSEAKQKANVEGGYL